MARSRILAPFLAALALAAAGCGGGGGPGPGPAPPDVVVPDVAGLRPGAAAERLCASGLDPEVLVAARTRPVQPMRAARAAPRVLGTDPPAGTRVGHGGVVRLRVSLPQNVSIALRQGC